MDSAESLFSAMQCTWIEEGEREPPEDLPVTVEDLFEAMVQKDTCNLRNVNNNFGMDDPEDISICQASDIAVELEVEVPFIEISNGSEESNDLERSSGTDSIDESENCTVQTQI